MKSLAILAMMILVAGCAQSSTNTYDESDVGQVIDVSQGRVMSSRVVDIKGKDPKLGPVAGAGVGAATGGFLIGSGKGSAAAAILGGLIGAGVGYFAEKGASGREGIEYIVELDDGRVATIVQNREDEERPISDGTPILVQWGGEYTRVVPRPESVQGTPGAAGWDNPDSVTSDQPYDSRDTDAELEQQ